MSIEIRRKMEERKQVLTDMQALHSRDKFTSLEEEGWNKLNERYDSLSAEIDALSRTAAINARAAELARPMFDGAPAARADVATTNFAATPEYREQFVRALMTRNMSEMRTMYTLTSNAPVPVDMQRRIVELMEPATVLRSICTVLNVASDQQITIDATWPTGYLVDENSTWVAGTPGAVTVSDVSFVRKTIGDYPFAVRMHASRQAIADYIGGGDWMARRMAVGLAQVEETYLINGDGSATSGTNAKQPTGIVTAIDTIDNKYTSTAGSTGQGYATIAGDDIIETAHKVKPQYRNGNYRWLMRDEMAKAVRKIKDGNNRYLWQVGDSVAEGLTNGINGQLYGIPVTISQHLPTAVTAGAFAAAIGNWSYVEIYDRGGIEFDIDDKTALSKLQTFFQVWKRSDVVVTNSEAFAHLEFK
jgi:HK97 family phage major capsid protein